MLLVQRVRESAYRRYFDTVRLCGDERVLDVGCGSGAGSRYLAERLDNGGSLTCLEICPEWLQVARQHLARFNNVEFVQGDAARIRLPDSAYDVAVLHFVLHEVERCDHCGLMRNVAGALKPGGRLYLRERRGDFHGAPVVDIRTLASEAGLRFEQAAGGRVLSIGPTTELVFARA